MSNVIINKKGVIKMFEITLICMGKLKEKFYLSAADKYIKRLAGFCKFKLIELNEIRLPDCPSNSEITAGLEKEFQKVPGFAFLHRKEKCCLLISLPIS